MTEQSAAPTESGAMTPAAGDPAAPSAGGTLRLEVAVSAERAGRPGDAKASLSGQALRQVPETLLARTATLRELDLSGNHLEHLPATLDYRSPVEYEHRSATLAIAA